MTTWHVPDDDLRRYAGRRLAPPLLWSAETHVAACAVCRDRLAALVPVDAGWARVDAALDAPTPGPVERVLLAVGVPDHTARLLTATPALRLSWLAAVAVTLALTALVASVTDLTVFLAVAPLLPLVGVAVSFGPGIDPTYEVTVTAPVHAFRLLLLRCVAVLTANTALSVAASLLIPGYGLAAIGWFLPSLALMVVALLLSPRLGPVLPAVGVGLSWVLVVLVAGALPFSVVGQLTILAAVAALSFGLARRAAVFDLIPTWRIR